MAVWEYLMQIHNALDGDLPNENINQILAIVYKEWRVVTNNVWEGELCVTDSNSDHYKAEYWCDISELQEVPLDTPYRDRLVACINGYYEEVYWAESLKTGIGLGWCGLDFYPCKPDKLFNFPDALKNETYNN